MTGELSPSGQPGDNRPGLRVSHEDRDRVVEALRIAAGDGRLTAEELERYEAIEKKQEEPWPSIKYLRPGAQATGWVLLSNVPLWYELWRQFNGFQPTVPSPTTDSQTGESQNGESRSR